MRLYLVIDETCFYLPDFVARFLERTRDTVVGAALIKKVSSKNSIDLYLSRHWYYLNFFEIIKLISEKGIKVLMDSFMPKKRSEEFHSCKSVLEFYGIEYTEIEYTLNKPQYLEKIRKTQPDVIISSNSIIFGKDVLRIPKICCLNRHSALLPAYGGLFPVLQAYRCGEKSTGVSVHIMKEEIDAGPVLAQKEITIQKDDTIDALYKKCYAVSVDVLLEAIEKVRAGDFVPYVNNRKPSYFSFPKKEHWRQFRKRGGKFI